MRLLLLTLILTFCTDQRVFAYENDHLDAEQLLLQNVVPFNVAKKASIKATSTCGEIKPTKLCYLDTFTGYRNRSECDECDASQSKKSHPAEYAIDGHNTFWASEIGPREVKIDIDLRQHFYISSIILKMGPSLPPRNWKLLKSLDGNTFTPWQYFAGTPEECKRDFNTPVHSIPRDAEDVLCVTTHQRQDMYGEIHIQLLEGRPGSRDFDHNDKLKKWTDARYIRLHFLRPETYGENLYLVPTHDDSFNQLIYYSLRDVTVLAYCICHGYSDSCKWSTRRNRFVCNCTLNTCGEECTKCCDGFSQHAWRPFSSKDPTFSCERCNCFGHSSDCVYNSTVDEKKLSLDLSGRRRGGGMCLNCQNNTSGINCERCIPGFYRSSSAPRTARCEDCSGCPSVLLQDTNHVIPYVDYTNKIMIHLYNHPEIVFARRRVYSQLRLSRFKQHLEDLSMEYYQSAYGFPQTFSDLLNTVSTIDSQTHTILKAATTADNYTDTISSDTLRWKTVLAENLDSEASRVLNDTIGTLSVINELNQEKSTLTEYKALQEARGLIKEIREPHLKKVGRKIRLEALAAKSLFKAVTSVCYGVKLSHTKCELQEKKLLALMPRFHNYIQRSKLILMRTDKSKPITNRNKAVLKRIRTYVGNYNNLTAHLNQSSIWVSESRAALNSANHHMKVVQRIEKKDDLLRNKIAMENWLLDKESWPSLLGVRVAEIKQLAESYNWKESISSCLTLRTHVRNISQHLKLAEENLNEANAIARSIDAVYFRSKSTMTQANLLLNRSKTLTNNKGSWFDKMEIDFPPSEFKFTTTGSKKTSSRKNVTEEVAETTTSRDKITFYLSGKGEELHTITERTTEYWTEDTDEGSSADGDAEDVEEDVEDVDGAESTSKSVIQSIFSWPWGDEPNKKYSALHLQKRRDQVGYTRRKLNNNLETLQQRLKEYTKAVASYKNQISRKVKEIDVRQYVDKSIQATKHHQIKNIPEFSEVGKNSMKWVRLEDRIYKLGDRITNSTKMAQTLNTHPCANKTDTPCAAVYAKKKLENYFDDVGRLKNLAEKIKLKQEHHQFNRVNQKMTSLREKIEAAKLLARRFKGPVNFSSPGFVSPSLPDHILKPSAITHIELRFMSMYEDGWLLTTSRRNEKSFYIFVRLVESHLEICASLDEELKCTRLLPRLTTERWFYLSLLRIGHRMTTTLNTLESENTIKTIVWEKASNYVAFLAEPMYVGGIPESFKINQSMKNDLDGAMTLSLNGYEVGLISANQQSGQQEFHLHSASRMDVRETLISFSGKGYHKLPIEFSSKPMSLEFMFRSFEDGVLLAHIQTSRKTVYLSVWLRFGNVSVRYNEHHNFVKLVSHGGKYNDGKWHHVEVRQQSNAWTLAVDQRDKSDEVFLHFAISKAKSWLLVGGLDHRTTELLPSSLQANWKPLVGCISNMTVRGIFQNMHNYESSQNATIGKCIMPTSKCSCISSRRTIELNYLLEAVDFATVTFKTNDTKSSIISYSLSMHTSIDVKQDKGKINIQVKNRHASGRYSNSDVTVNDGQWHILVLLPGKRSSLTIDDVTLEFNDRFKEPFYASQHILHLGGSPERDSSICYKDVAVNDRVLDLAGSGISCL